MDPAGEREKNGGAPGVRQTSAEMFGVPSAASSRYGSIMERRPMHQGVMTQAVLAVKQWHMAQLHNIKQFGGGASPLPKQHSDLANRLGRIVWRNADTKPEPFYRPTGRSKIVKLCMILVLGG